MATVSEVVAPGEIDAGISTLHVDQVTVLSGQVLLAGTVVGKVTASGKYKILAPGASDGTEAAAGVLWGAVDATGADKQGLVVRRLRELKNAVIVWPAGITGPQKIAATAQLEARMILLR